MTSVINISFEFDVTGKVELSERGERNKDEYYSSTDLVNVESAAVNINFDLEDDNSLLIDVSSYCVENKETKRVFHTRIATNLNRSDVEQLQEFLTLISGRLA